MSDYKPQTLGPEPKTAFFIPTIDLKAYLEDPDSPYSQHLVAEVRAACVTTGFFQITGHQISKELQERLFEAADAFFELPFETKKLLDAKNNVGHRGYDVLASQSYEADVLPDLKEGFYMGLEIPPSDPRVVARRFFMGSNVWPPTKRIAPEQFKNTLEEYYREIWGLTMTVLDLIARTLPYGPHVFDQFRSNDPIAPFRLLHYPPAQPTEQRQLGASAHTDFGAITLLLQDGNPGLSVLDEATNTWHDVDPNPDAYVVNIGDMLSKWTSNQYKSSVHRVINATPNHRYSAVFFFDGNLDCPLAPLDGSPVTGKVLTVEDHMLARMRESYGVKSGTG